MEEVLRAQDLGDHAVWADASHFLSLVCNDLAAGELVHGENFSLYEAMSALEIMDPKMDAGMASVGFNTVEDAIEAGAAPVDLSVLQLIDVMDHLLACEATWHMGHSLTQTVFSCLFVLRVERTTSNPLLHAFCMVMRATCSLLRSIVSSTQTTDEEEFFTAAFGLPLDGQADGRCLSLLNSAEELVARQLRRCKGIASKKKVIEDIEPLQEDSSLEEGYCVSILSRLRFRKAYYHALANLNKPQGRGLETARKHISTAQVELAAISESSKFLSTCLKKEEPLSSIECSTASGGHALGFEPSVNKGLSAPTPPRSISVQNWAQTTGYFVKLLQDLDHLCSFSSNLSLEEVMQTIVDYQKCNPDLIVRALLQVRKLLAPEVWISGDTAMRNSKILSTVYNLVIIKLLVVRDNKLFGHEPAVDVVNKELKSFSMESTPDIDRFMKNAGQLILCQLRILCANVAWQRRKLGKLLGDWASLWQQAESVHEFLQLSNKYDASVLNWWEQTVKPWIAEQASWTAMQFSMLGFELDLYAPYEYSMIYWYLAHVIHTLLDYKQIRIRSLEPEQAKYSEGADSTKKKGKKKKGLARALEKEANSTHGALLHQCYADSCGGLLWEYAPIPWPPPLLENMSDLGSGKYQAAEIQMISALRDDHKIVFRETFHNTEQERFLQRFELLHKTPIPPPLSYKQYKESVGDQNLSVRKQYQLSDHYFMALQHRLQELSRSLAKATNISEVSRTLRLTEIRQLEQIALRNHIALQIVDRAGPGDSLRVSFEFSVHRCFAVAVVKNSS